MSFIRTVRYCVRHMGLRKVDANTHLENVRIGQQQALQVTRRSFHVGGKSDISRTRLQTLINQNRRNHYVMNARPAAVRTLTSQLSDTGNSCTITWEDGFRSVFHSAWLRQNCHCEQCRHGNGQRMIDPTRISHDIKLDSVDFKDGHASLKWKGESETGHVGKIPLKYLRENNYNDESLFALREAVKIDPAVKEIPSVSYESIKNSDKGRLRWMKQINEAGLSIVKDVPTELGMVQKVAELIGPAWDSIYGTVFDVKSMVDPINVAYSNIHLDYHMDLVYFESPPGLQLLHCLKFDSSVKGGQSTFLDVHAYAEEFRTKHPEHFHTLTIVPATFQKIHYDRDLPVHLVNQKPHIKLNHHGDIIAVYWAPTFEGPLFVSGKDVERYYAAYEEFAKGMIDSTNQLTYTMVPGDLMVFNNIRILHGRTQFEGHGGERHLQGAYVNIDIFKSHVQVMSNLVGDGSLPKRVGNQCWR